MRVFLLQVNFILVAFVNFVIFILPYSWLRILFLRLCGFKVSFSASLQARVRITSLRGALEIGVGTVIGAGVLLDNRRGIFIGSNVNISRECLLLTLGHDISLPDFPTIGAPIFIKDSAWLFMGVKVMPGVTIGNNSVLYSFSVLTKDTEDFSVYAGCPARRIPKKVAKRSNQKPYRYIGAF